MIDKYGVENPGQLPHTAWNKGLTKDTDERMKKASDNHKGLVAWNKGLTKETDSRIVCHPQDEETRNKIRNTHLSKDFK